MKKNKISKKDKGYVMYADGASWGNPGPSSLGVVLYNATEEEIYKSGVFLGHTTNNVAEYRAIEEGLLRSVDLGVKNLKVYSDSQLIIRQLNGKYKVNNLNLKKIYNRIKKVEKDFNSINYEFLNREHTKVPHRLATGILESRK
ncbi:MAG: ribonuclease HI family protein [Elusimicrobiota bacterium]